MLLNGTKHNDDFMRKEEMSKKEREVAAETGFKEAYQETFARLIGSGSTFVEKIMCNPSIPASQRREIRDTIKIIGNEEWFQRSLVEKEALGRQNKEALDEEMRDIIKNTYKGYFDSGEERMEDFSNPIAVLIDRVPIEGRAGHENNLVDLLGKKLQLVQTDPPLGEEPQDKKLRELVDQARDEVATVFAEIVFYDQERIKAAA